MNAAARFSGPVRVLHAVGAMNRGGVETWIMHLVRHFDPNRVRIDVVVHSADRGEYDAELAERGCRVLRCPHLRRPIRYGGEFRRLLRDRGPYDVVHSHLHHFAGLQLRLARRAGVPVRIAHSHLDSRAADSNASWPRRLYLGLMRRWIEKHATVRLAASRQAGEALFGSRMSWQTLYCAVDFDPFETPADRASILGELGLPPDSLALCHVGRFAEQKNHAFLVRIAAEVFARESRARLVLIGDGPLRPEIERDVHELGIADRVRFLGSRPDVPRVLTAMDAFLLPSRFEGLPLVGMEAQAAGLPTIVSDAVTPEVDIVPGLVERIALSESAAVWAERTIAAARRFRSAPERRQALESARRSPFDIRQGAHRLEEVYVAACAAK
jgi:glycosyltransferase involved in cell wall biosynthesis